MHKGYLIFS